MEYFFTIIIGFIIGFIIFYIISKLSKKNEGANISKGVEDKLNEMFPKLLNNANEQLVRMAKEKLGAEKEVIKTDLKNKKETIDNLVKGMLEEIEKSNKKLETAERERIGSFKQLQEALSFQKDLTEKLRTTTEGLRNVLSNNQMRGQFGEQVAEDLLRMNGFVRGTDYEFNKSQQTKETRPDFAIFLPDGIKINVDAKFPYKKLQEYSEAESKSEKERLLKEFKQDVKTKIKQVTTRDYINPEENTVDFVILFIPNEMIFSFIYDKMSDVWSDAMRNKVIMAGPFSFTAILRMVRQAYDNFKYQKNTQKIITYIKTFEKEFGKYNEEFVKIGTKIEQLSSQYEKVDGVRSRQLLRTMDKIKLNDESSAVDQVKVLNETESQNSLI